MMLASAWVPLAIHRVHAQPTSTLAVAGLVIGTLCQLCSMRVTSNRLRSALLVLGSALQFVAVALVIAMEVT